VRAWPVRAFISACWNGQIDAAKFLLVRGADINARPYKGRTALIYAAWSGHLGMVRWLVEDGADLTVQDEQFGGDALGFAHHNGRAEIEAYLAAALAPRQDGGDATVTTPVI
jgi:hypothetical protein